jgi:hypothetical protein
MVDRIFSNTARHHDLSHLEGDGSAVANDFRTVSNLGRTKRGQRDEPSFRLLQPTIPHTRRLFYPQV